jgi:tetratricopeptide (TPR) repeat protein
MVDPHANGCPEPEVLAAYVDRGLSLSERAGMDAHLASCPQCIALVAGVARTVEELSAHGHDGALPAEATPLVTRRSVAGALAAAAAVIAVLAAPALVRPLLERDSGLVSLVDSVGEQRSVLGRLTGGFLYAPLGEPSAGGQDGRAAGADHVQLTAGRIRESFGERETPSQLHVRGVSHLLSRRYDDAAQLLLAASREQPANARYLNDVAAVQLERARLGLRPDDLPRALAAADRARRLDPSLKEAWFNRALAFTALSLTDQAKDAWKSYLQRDSVSSWAVEARSRLAELEQPTPITAWDVIAQELTGTIEPSLADRALQTQMAEARTFLETVIVRDWAVAVESGGDALAPLARLRAMADAFARAGDSQYADSVAVIDRAEILGAPTLRRLASAHQQYIRAASAFTNDRFPEAAANYEEAKRQLDAFNSPFALRAEIEFGALANITGRTDEAIAILTKGVEAARVRGYAFAEGRSNWFLGLAAFNKGQLGDARNHYEQTLAAFERIGDTEMAAGAHNLLASLHGYLGDAESAWHHRRFALAALPGTKSERLKYMVLAGAAAAVRRDDPESSLGFQDAVVESAEHSGRVLAVIDALSTRAAVLTELGLNERATDDLQRARLALSQVPDQVSRERVEEMLLAAESDYFRTLDPARAIAAAQTAIDRVGKRNDRLRFAQLSLKLARANIAWGRLEAAESALTLGIDAFERERSSLVDAGRVSTLDDAWRLFDTATQLRIKRKDYAKAFAMAERARTRTAALARTAPTNRSLAEVQSQLDDDEAVVTVDQFDDELSVWIIKRHGMFVSNRPVARRDAQRLVSQFQEEIHSETARPQAGGALYDEIIRPAHSALNGISRLVIVPSAPFDKVSFAALWDRSARRFLVETATVRNAPSVALAAQSRSNPVNVTALSQVLIIGGPGGEAGVASVAAIYPNASVVIGAGATRSRVVHDATDRSVVHLVADARRNLEYPMLSQLRLADDPGRPYSGQFLGRDIAAIKLPRTRLVVIDSASRTNELHHSDAPSSLAQAFLSAGVMSVLDTLPGAESDAIRHMMVGFHGQMQHERSAEEALSRLQRNAIQQNGRRLGAWTALVLYGSDR